MASDSNISTATANADTDTSEAIIGTVSNLPNFAELLPDTIQPYWQMIQKYPFIEPVVIIFLFWLLAYLFRRYVINLIQKLVSKTQTDIDNNIIDSVKGPVFSTVIWLGISVAFNSLGLSSNWAKYVNPAIITIIIIIWMRVGSALSSSVFTAMSRSQNNFKQIDIRTEPLLIITSKILVLVIAAYLILVVWGINPVGLLASAGIVGVAVGFAAKDTLSNLFSGVFILADQPYTLGDYVNLDSGERGKVTHIGIRSTRIITRDDIEITVPNGIMGNTKVINESGGSHPKMRLRIGLQCAYDAHLEQVEALLMKIAEGHESVCEHPAPRVRVRGFGESGIDLQLLCWIDHPEGRGLITHLLYTEIHNQFREHNIEIPYPRREIQMLKSEEK